MFQDGHIIHQAFFSNCGKNIDHAVQLTGILNGVWEVKNSWDLPGARKVSSDWLQVALAVSANKVLIATLINKEFNDV